MTSLSYHKVTACNCHTGNVQRNRNRCIFVPPCLAFITLDPVLSGWVVVVFSTHRAVTDVVGGRTWHGFCASSSTGSSPARYWSLFNNDFLPRPLLACSWLCPNLVRHKLPIRWSGQYLGLSRVLPSLPLCDRFWERMQLGRAQRSRWHRVRL